MKGYSEIGILAMVVVMFAGCGPEEPPAPKPVDNKFKATPFSLELPGHFAPMPMPKDNPLTVEGVELGRHLFYEKKLSGDNTMNCATCHMAEFAFADTARVSEGIDGSKGTRQAMVLQNLGWAAPFFWDGRSKTLEEQALEPIMNPIEMKETWSNAVAELQNDPKYPNMFLKAFGTDQIDSTLCAKAMAQFMRTMVSGNSKFDSVVRGETVFTLDEQIGFNLFVDLKGADCQHCHPATNSFFTDHSYQNNGMDVTLKDMGLGAVTGNPLDNGKFKIPSLRNIEYSAPYMHDGRFKKLEGVIKHYNSGVKSNSPNISPLMEFAHQGGVKLTPKKTQQVLAFLCTLSDPSFLNNPAFSDPN